MTDPAVVTWADRAERRLLADPDLAPHVDTLLAWADTEPDYQAALQFLADASAGQLLGWVLGKMPPAHNGWPNFPTWAAVQWHTGVAEADYQAAVALVAGAGPDRAPAVLAKAVKDGHPLADQPGLYTDLLTWAIGQVQWGLLAMAVAEGKGTH